MNSRQRRVHAIELTLTPQQVVMVWLRDAMQAGTFEEGARHSPPYRGEVANKVLRAVRASMQGQPGPLVERAILQGRREADSLYLLVTNANIAVLRGYMTSRRTTAPPTATTARNGLQLASSLGAGPWFHGADNFRGHVNNRLHPEHGYTGPKPNRGDKPEQGKRLDKVANFKGNEVRDGRGHAVGGKH